MKIDGAKSVLVNLKKKDSGIEISLQMIKFSTKIMHTYNNFERGFSIS